MPAQEILTPAAAQFVTDLQTRFGEQRVALLGARVARQRELDSGVFPDFLTSTQNVRSAAWRVAPLPADLQDRRVEITGPVDRKMVINALNSGAQVFMADFEDSHSPTWSGTLAGQINLRDAIRKTISFENADGKSYRLNAKTAVLFVRPRGWHLEEKHFLVNGKPVSASLFDFGLFFFHNVKALLERGTGPYFYLPKLESHLEARLWNDVFVYAQTALGIAQGTIKATVLIETILAAFEMDEILYELKEHSAGLNCGRWDYIFSFIKKLSAHPDFVLPDRAKVTMREHFLNSYCRRLIETCHKREVHAMGGMAAQIPIKNDARANEEALAKVTADKEREVDLGHDGTWVAHPALVPIARAVFDARMKTPNQIALKKTPSHITAKDLLTVPQAEISEAGLVNNISVGLQYIEAWLGGNGCVPLYHLMEDAATAEISRAQIWQWIRHPKGRLSDGRKVTVELFRKLLAAEKTRIVGERGSSAQLEAAYALFDKLVTTTEFTEFLTLAAYNQITEPLNTTEEKAHA